jgi:hypothetical protein
MDWPSANKMNIVRVIAQVFCHHRKQVILIVLELMLTNINRNLIKLRNA